MAQIQPVAIPVSELRPGLTTWKIDIRTGQLVPDEYLEDFFLGSYSPREWMRRIQFHVGENRIAVWRPSGKVYVTTGNHKRKARTGNVY